MRDHELYAAILGLQAPWTVDRVDLDVAGGVVQTAVPWASPGSKFTTLFERLAIDWRREAAVTAVARQLKLGWDGTALRQTSLPAPRPAARRRCYARRSRTAARRHREPSRCRARTRQPPDRSRAVPPLR